MNQQQRKYALERIDSILAQKLKALEAKHTTPGKTLTSAEKLDLVKQGKVKPEWSKNYYDYRDPVVSLDFSKFESKASVSAAGKAAITKLRKQAQLVKDTIALGEASEALNAISSFEK